MSTYTQRVSRETAIRLKNLGMPMTEPSPSERVVWRDAGVAENFFYPTVAETLDWFEDKFGLVILTRGRAGLGYAAEVTREKDFKVPRVIDDEKSLGNALEKAITSVCEMIESL